ncbi:MAG TPA: DUF4185 domain-containing protein [Chthoniobacterales bacterium]|nr:DUF4185 domain-containing protein [Chthoniobacterales bacterium]
MERLSLYLQRIFVRKPKPHNSSFLLPPLAAPALLASFLFFQHSAGASPLIKEIQVEKIGALTGPTSPNGQLSADVCGADLGTMTEIGRKIFFAFGDTFGYVNGRPVRMSGVDWRSNVFASAPAENVGEVPRLTWRTDATGKAIPIIDGAHLPAFTGSDGEQTKIPTAMVSVGNRIYLHYMSVHGFAPKGGVWECNYSKFIYSDDFGKTWTPLETPFGGRDSNFNMLALTDQRGSGNEDGAYVYAFGTPCGRFGGVKLARVPVTEVQDFDSWDYYSGKVNVSAAWVHDPSKAVDIIPPPIGEASILWNPFIRRWMYTYLNEQTASIKLREAEEPWGPWSVPNAVTTAHDYPQLYGAFMTPSFLKDDGKTFYFIMSMYGPYNTFLMKATLVLE